VVKKVQKCQKQNPPAEVVLHPKKAPLEKAPLEKAPLENQPLEKHPLENLDVKGFKKKFYFS
jgi:hypothetical protein